MGGSHASCLLGPRHWREPLVRCACSQVSVVVRLAGVEPVENHEGQRATPFARSCRGYVLPALHALWVASEARCKCIATGRGLEIPGPRSAKNTNGADPARTGMNQGAALHRATRNTPNGVHMALIGRRATTATAGAVASGHNEDLREP